MAPMMEYMLVRFCLVAASRGCEAHSPAFSTSWPGPKFLRTHSGNGSYDAVDLVFGPSSPDVVRCCFFWVVVSPPSGSYTPTMAREVVSLPMHAITTSWTKISIHPFPKLRSNAILMHSIPASVVLPQYFNCCSYSVFEICLTIYLI
jgi:hypothetical protein